MSRDFRGHSAHIRPQRSATLLDSLPAEQVTQLLRAFRDMDAPLLSSSELSALRALQSASTVMQTAIHA